MSRKPKKTEYAKLRSIFAKLDNWLAEQEKSQKAESLKKEKK